MDSESAEIPPEIGESQFRQAETRMQWVGWSSFFFAFVQSVCTAFAALSGVRLLIGAAAFASAAGLMGFADRTLHNNSVRLPMMVLALAGCLFNLVAVWQVWRLRRRASSAWRQKPVTARKRNLERLQLGLSILTLLLLAAEWFYHIKFTGHG